MLQLVLGQSGSGKSVEMHKMLLDFSEEQIMFLVPEQSSFDAEKTICNFLPPKNRRNVEVLTFSRLCDNIFRRYGSLAGERISDSGKCMLMSVALDSLKDSLKVYKNYHHRPEFIKKMTVAIDEFKNAGLTPECIDELCVGQTGASIDKLRELAMIYGLYASVLEGQGMDSRDDLLRATAFVSENAYFEGKIVFIDGFKDFTGAQRNLVDKIIEQSRMVVVSLCTDGLESRSVMFSSPNNTATHLIKQAKIAGKEIKTPILLPETKRTSSKDLQTVAENFLRHNPESYDGECGNVKIYCAKNPRDEVEFIAASIGDLVRNHGYRYKDIAVVGRNQENYRSLLSDAFLRYDIPVFDDNRDRISTKPLVKLITALISAARNKNDIDVIFTMLKSPFSPFDYEMVCEFETYCFIWNLTGKDLREELKNHPQGLGKEFDEKSRAKLDSFEEMRKKIITLIDNFAEKTETCDGIEFATQVYDFICNFGAEQKIREQNDRESVEVFNCAIDCLEQMATVLKGMNFGIERMEDFLKTALLESDYGKIPQHLDEVTVGAANRIRYASPKAVFIFGAVDGVFPALIKNDAIVGWDERAFLCSKGVNIPDNEKGLYADERYFAYMAIAAPSERLFVCYPSAELSGEVCFKSLIVSQIEKLLPKVEHLTRDNLPHSLFLQTRKGILHYFAEHFLEDDALREAIKRTDDGALAKLQKNAEEKDFDLNDSQLSATLFGRDMKLSASQVEKFYKCRFSYFCEKGLHVYPLRKIEMDPMQSGNFIHHCLYELLSKRTKEEFIELTSDEISELCDHIAEDYLAKKLVAADFSDKRFVTLMMRMRNGVKRLATRLQEEFRESDFTPVGFEEKISKYGDVKPYILTLSNGSTVRIEGSVDRIDMFEKDGERYVRIIDYKSGSKSFNAGDVEYGLNIQMLLYLFAVCNDNSGKYANSQPAGILYMPVGDKYDDEADDATLKHERLEKYKMNGLVLNDEKVVRAMENGGQGKFIPVKFNKDSTMYAFSSVASAKEFDEMKKSIEDSLRAMGELLLKGRVAPAPTEAKGYTVCEYCPYTLVCKKQQLVEDDE